MPKRSAKPTKLHNTLILFHYVLDHFHVTELDELTGNGELKRPVFEELTDTNLTRFCDFLCQRPNTLGEDLLRTYDQNIVSHTLRISEHREPTIRWRYFQYLALLFTEIYLDKYFRDRQGFLEELNAFRERYKRRQNDLFSQFHTQGGTDFTLDVFTEDDLHKLAFWNATGSGKTLLMHVNLLQYLHYQQKHQRQDELNRIILLTPNEGLSEQHLREFELSGLPASLFRKGRGSLFDKHEVQVLDIHKLAEESGDKTVAVEAFEANNLVFIDEGHRGARSANDTGWKVMRDRLSAEGFSFEYSATFGQAVSSASGSHRQSLLQEYAKSTLFDYSYRHFYKDGYGKDYHILNLQDAWDERINDLYLTACLLRFYQQMQVYLDHRPAMTAFGTEKPLCIFVGGKVTAVRTENKQKVSDVVFILQFLQRFVSQREQSIRDIEGLLQGTSGLVDSGHRSIFQNAFSALVKTGQAAEAVYTKLLEEVFNTPFAGAELHLDNLKGAKGEIGLRMGTGDYFGVINVGDDKKLLELCEASGIHTSELDFSSSLFHRINRTDATVNILIGSKKFSEGWSSWRVSTMGLMNIGQGEGSEVIQLFGRGVRLRGFEHSLKRSAHLDSAQRPESIPENLNLLETLNVFGVRADYMQQFKAYLEEEGLPPNDGSMAKVTVPAMLTVNLGEKPLKVLKVRDGAVFKRAVEFELPDATTYRGNRVVVDWYPKLQTLQSTGIQDATPEESETGVLSASHTAFFNWDQLNSRLQQFKNERGWHNLCIPRSTVQGLLASNDWYTLYVPSHQLEFNGFEQVRDWQDMALALLKGYVERTYNRAKNRYLSQHLEVELLDANHPNVIAEHTFRVAPDNTTLIEKLEQLSELITSENFREDFLLGSGAKAIFFANHLYQPLIYFKAGDFKDVLEVSPVQLNPGERDFVMDLREYVKSEPAELEGKELYLLRNESRRGISFFEASGFYPDFILWILDGEKQYVNFIDPKGLRQIEGFENEKINLHQRIRTEIEPQLNDPNLVLNSFIVSVTPFKELRHWKGQESPKDFKEKHVFFKGDGEYIGRMIRKVLSN